VLDNAATRAGEEVYDFNGTGQKCE
jgi:hypothetical protein